MKEFNSKIDFSNSGHLKLCLLSQGLNIENKSLFQSKEFSENQFPYGYSTELVKNFSRTPSEIILPQEVIVGLHLKRESPWSLKVQSKNKDIYLAYKDKKITRVLFDTKPSFYGEKLSNGISAEKVSVMYGPFILSFFSRGWCYYFLKNKQCKFCSLAPTRKGLGSENIISITPDLAEEVVKLAISSMGKNIHYINYCSGSHMNNDLGVSSQIELLKRTKKVAPKSVKHHMLTMPPNNPKLLEELLEAGLDTLNFAIEVFDKKLFKKICPGKQKFYGYEKFLDILEIAVSIFPKNKVYVNFVGGLEPIASMNKTFEYFSKRGITPSVNIFHPDPESEFSKFPAPSIDYLLELASNLSAVYSKNNFKPIFERGGTRNSIDTEVFRGFYN